MSTYIYGRVTRYFTPIVSVILIVPFLTAADGANPGADYQAALNAAYAAGYEAGYKAGSRPGTTGHIVQPISEVPSDNTRYLDGKVVWDPRIFPNNDSIIPTWESPTDNATRYMFDRVEVIAPIQDVSTFLEQQSSASDDPSSLYGLNINGLSKDQLKKVLSAVPEAKQSAHISKSRN